MSLNMKCFVAKWSCGCIATGKNLERWQHLYCGACPYYLPPDEDTKYVLLCSHADSITT